ncbi:MAG: hypothetical protein L0Y72_05075 [Gemmataceae bacterium]|nr:hypothetical protein [Gemmataceae bacterium]MCI0738395.1 hypothetical protein [Gemmataceae bacterium]
MSRTVSVALLILAFSSSSVLSNEKPRLRLLDDETHSIYLSFWPRSNDPWLNELKKKDLIFYDESVMPHAYQDWDGGLPGVHSPSYNISAIRGEPFGNANREFPWNSPAGLHDSPNFKAFRFVSIPPGKAILWWRERIAGDRSASFRWQYPAGTVFGEILLVTDPEGYDWAFELRTRTRSDKGWMMNAFRPFTTERELVARIKELVPNWRERPELAKIVKGELEREESLRLVNNHDRVIFDSTALASHLPAIDHALVRKLLVTPFKSALGQGWKQRADGTEAFAPTTSAPFHIVPKNYKGGFIEVSSNSCMRCHDSTLMHARDFQARRDWYGRVRGSDNIFSFHIFEPSSISFNGFSREPQIRRALVDAGLLQKWED